MSLDEDQIRNILIGLLANPQEYVDQFFPDDRPIYCLNSEASDLQQQHVWQPTRDGLGEDITSDDKKQRWLEGLSALVALEDDLMDWNERINTALGFADQSMSRRCFQELSGVITAMEERLTGLADHSDEYKRQFHHTIKRAKRWRFAEVYRSFSTGLCGLPSLSRNRLLANAEFSNLDAGDGDCCKSLAAEDKIAHTWHLSKYTSSMPDMINTTDLSSSFKKIINDYLQCMTSVGWVIFPQRDILYFYLRRALRYRRIPEAVVISSFSGPRSDEVKMRIEMLDIDLMISPAAPPEWLNITAFTLLDAGAFQVYALNDQQHPYFTASSLTEAETGYKRLLQRQECTQRIRLDLMIRLYHIELERWELSGMTDSSHLVSISTAIGQHIESSRNIYNRSLLHFRLLDIIVDIATNKEISDLEIQLKASVIGRWSLDHGEEGFISNLAILSYEIGRRWLSRIGDSDRAMMAFKATEYIYQSAGQAFDAIIMILAAANLLQAYGQRGESHEKCRDALQKAIDINDPVVIRRAQETGQPEPVQQAIFSVNGMARAGNDEVLHGLVLEFSNRIDRDLWPFPAPLRWLDIPMQMNKMVNNRYNEAFFPLEFKILFDDFVAQTRFFKEDLTSQRLSKNYFSQQTISSRNNLHQSGNMLAFNLMRTRMVRFSSERDKEEAFQNFFPAYMQEMDRHLQSCLQIEPTLLLRLRKEFSLRSKRQALEYCIDHGIVIPAMLDLSTHNADLALDDWHPWIALMHYSAALLLSATDEDLTAIQEARVGIERSLRLFRRAKSELPSPQVRIAYANDRHVRQLYQYAILAYLRGVNSKSNPDSYLLPPLYGRVFEIMEEFGRAASHNIDLGAQPSNISFFQGDFSILRFLWEVQKVQLSDRNPPRDVRDDDEQVISQDIEHTDVLVRNDKAKAELYKSVLGPKVLVLNYFLGDHYLFMLALSARHGIVPFNKLQRESANVNRIQRLLGILEEFKNRLEEVKSFRKELSMLLIKPFESLLNEFERVVIVAQGGLAQVPFHILLKDGKPLIMNHVVSYLTFLSPESLAKSATKVRTKIKQGLLGIGVGDLGQQSTQGPEGVHFEEKLFGTGAEAMSLADMLSRFPHKALLLRGEDASKDVILEHLQSADILHFATHADFNSYAPLRSRIHLAKSNSLQPHELLLRKTDAALIILTCCSSGRAQTTKSGEWIGFAQILQAVGAHSVIAASWRVFDNIAAYTVKRFYLHLNGCMEEGTWDLAKSLTLAIRDTIELGSFKLTWEDVADWGALSLYGIPSVDLKTPSYSNSLFSSTLQIAAKCRIL